MCPTKKTLKKQQQKTFIYVWEKLFVICFVQRISNKCFCVIEIGLITACQNTGNPDMACFQ